MIVALNLQINYFDTSGPSYSDADGRGVLRGIRSYLSTKDINSVIYVQGIRPISDSVYGHQVSQCFGGAQETSMMPLMVPLIKRKLVASYPDATRGTPLVSMLNVREEVELMGAETCSSVLFTAASLRMLGFSVVVRESLVASRDSYLHSMGMTLLASELGVKILE